MHSLPFAIVAAALCLHLPNPARSQLPVPAPLPDTVVLPSEGPLQTTRDRVLRLIAKDSLPSLAVAAFAGGRLVWSEALGFSDRQNGIPATVSTPYGFGSVSKSITGTALMRLAARGAIALDAPLDTYLRDPAVRVLVGWTSDLTVRRLLAMRGGIPHYVRNYWLDESLQAPSGDELIRDYGISVAPPGSRYMYSNLAYGIAERLIEKVTGETYPEHMAENVFAPLGMAGARVRRDPADPAGARVYHSGDSALAYWFTDPEGGAALQASLRDLIRYAHHHLAAPASISPVVPGHPDDPPFDYFLGWGILNVGAGNRILISDGNVFGAVANLQIFPREDAFAILLTNSSAVSPIIESLSLEIARAVAPVAAGGRDSLFASADWPPEQFREEPWRAEDEWEGRWQGFVHTPTGVVPVEVSIGDSATVGVTVGAGESVPAREVARVGDRLEGWADVRVPTRDTEGLPHSVRFSLAIHDGRLSGTFTAWTADDPRSHFVLPFFADLERVPAAAPK